MVQSSCKMLLIGNVGCACDGNTRLVALVEAEHSKGMIGTCAHRVGSVIVTTLIPDME